MRKSLLCFLIIAAAAFSGCQKSSDQFLPYEAVSSIGGNSFDSQLTAGEFFAKDLAIVTDQENVGGDEELTSGASLLVDLTDRKILYADHVYDKMYPASLTKLMTALLVLRYGELTDPVTITYDASHISEANAKVCGYEKGDVISLESLLYSLLIYSGNDAAIAIADHLKGNTEAFAGLMNEEAQKLGAVHSNFVNPNGLHDDNHYTSAYDIYLIFNELLKYDTFRTIINTDSYTAVYKDKDGNEKQKTYHTTNLYLNKEAEEVPGLEVIGGKTGTTSKAGNCLALLSKGEDGKEYISVILKADGITALYSQMSHLLTKATQ
jgi:D-alanyl-D-alanine carboxypeptidase